jgi:hypothetical protein
VVGRNTNRGGAPRVAEPLRRVRDRLWGGSLCTEQPKERGQPRVGPCSRLWRIPGGSESHV